MEVPTWFKWAIIFGVLLGVTGCANCVPSVLNNKAGRASDIGAAAAVYAECAWMYPMLWF